MRGPSSYRWLTFSVSALVLMTGILVLSGAAAGTGLAPIPDPDDEAATVAVSSGVNDSGVVDQLDTWAETKGKAKVSPVGKTRHGNDKDRNRLR
jgi:hypothetical protein